MGGDDDRRPDRTSRRTFLGAVGTASLLGTAGCSALARDAREVAIAGSSTVYPVTEAIASAFAEENPDVTVSVSQTGTGGGFSNFFCPGMTHVNNASREIAESEVDHCAENGVTPIEFQIATDALTVVANLEADWVDCLTVDELREIWRTDGASRWSDVRDGWPDEQFELYGADTTSGTFDYFVEAVIGEDANHRGDYHATERDRTIVQGVRGSRFAVGYFGFSYYSENPNAVKAVAIDGGDGCVEPSLETAKSGEYSPLSRPLFIYVAKEALTEPEVRDFVRFYLERAATDLVADVGYVPITESTRDEGMDRLDGAIEEVSS